MWNSVNTMGHLGHLMSPFQNQKRDFSFHVPSVPIVPGKTFTNPNFVNKHHPSVHSYQNNFILTPIQKISHNDSANVNNTKPPHTNCALVNSSQSIIDKVKENHIDVITTVDPNCRKEIVTEPVMCNSRKRNNKSRRNKRRKTPGKNSKQNINRQQINEMMDVDLELESSVNASDISMSPKTQNHPFNLTDFIVEKPNKTKPIDIERCESDEEEVFTMEISFSPRFSPSIGRLCVRERPVSITESEDSFIVFDSGTDEELEFSEESDDESEREDEDVDSSSPAIPHKRVRFAVDSELCEVHPMVQWSFAYQQARKGPWEEYARDRDRFSKRIAGAEKIISPILAAEHRRNVYGERFQDKC